MLFVVELENATEKPETYCVEIGENDSTETVRHSILLSCKLPNTDTLVLKVCIKIAVIGCGYHFYRLRIFTGK